MQHDKNGASTTLPLKDALFDGDSDALFEPLLRVAATSNPTTLGVGASWGAGNYRERKPAHVREPKMGIRGS